MPDMGEVLSDEPTTPRHGLSLWLVPTGFIVLIVIVTVWVTHEQSSLTQQRRQAEFDRVVDELEHDLAHAVSDRIDGFSAARDYVLTQDRIDATAFRSFLERRRAGEELTIPNDPGVIVAEYVDDPDELVARQRASGRSDFEVHGAAEPVDGPHVVITHVERELELDGHPLVGTDATAFREIIEPPDLFDQTDILVEMASIRDLMPDLGTMAIEADASGADHAVLLLVAPWTSPDGSAMGSIARLDSVDAIIETLAGEIPRHFSLVASVADSGDSIARIDRRDNGDTSVQFDHRMTVDAEHVDGVDLGGLDLRVLASDGFRNDREVDPTRTWFLGLLGAVLAAGFAVLRGRHAQRLARTGVELELAQAMASTDPLTGLVNRKGLVAAVDGRRPNAGTMVFIDIDDFKAVNDQDGHAAGDRVLRRIGHELRQLVRGSDVVCRLGGDEFLIYLFGVPVRGRIDELVGMMRNRIELIDHRISASIGYVHRDADDERSIEDLVTLADTAMYAQKRSKPRSRR